MGLRGSFKFLVPSLEVVTLQNMASFIKICVKGKAMYKEGIRVTIPLPQITDLYGVKLYSVFNFLFAAVNCLLFNHATLNYRENGGIITVQDMVYTHLCRYLIVRLAARLDSRLDFSITF